MTVRLSLLLRSDALLASDGLSLSLVSRSQSII